MFILRIGTKQTSFAYWERKQPGHGHLHWCHNPFNEAMISYPGSLTSSASVPPSNLDF